MSNIKLGKYQHFKGSIYEVIGIAKHSETLEELVIYKNIKTGELWVRPKSMFLEKINFNGKEVPRFKFIR
jgi:hypothetical protein